MTSLNSVSTPSVTLPLQNIDISAGYRYPETWNYQKSAHKPTLGTGASSGKTIQNDPGAALLVPNLTPAQASFVSDDVNDTVAGTGAQLVAMFGVNSNGYFRSEVIQMNGTTPVLSSDSYYTIDNALLVQQGAAGQQGTITFPIAGNSQGAILADQRNSLGSNFLVPINYTFYLQQIAGSGSSNILIEAFLQFNIFGGGTVLGKTNVFNASASAFSWEFPHSPIPVPSGTWVRFDASGNSGDNATIFLCGTMVHNDAIKEGRGHALGAPPGSIWDTVNL